MVEQLTIFNDHEETIEIEVHNETNNSPEEITQARKELISNEEFDIGQFIWRGCENLFGECYYSEKFTN